MISVALLTRNRRRLLQRCVGRLVAQLGPEDEIVILDTGSTDGTREWLARQPPSIRWAALDDKCDFAAARNTLSRQCSNPVILMLDDDTLPASDLLRRVRDGISSHMAVGGPALYGCRYILPWWWHPAIGWAVGMAGPDTVAAGDGAAPATSNLAVRRVALEIMPFGETPYRLGGQDMYYGGREDADWWRQARLRGWNVVINPRQIVFHEIPADRFRWAYVMSRVDSDGRADWERNPNPARLSDATNEIVHGAMSLLGDAAIALLRPQQMVARAVWLRRQYAFVSAACRPWPLLARALMPATAAQAKRLVAPALAAGMRLLRRARRLPSSRLTEIVIAAPTYLGDTVLVRYLSDALAQALPETRIKVLSRFPELFHGGPQNVSHVNAVDKTKCRAAVRTCDRVLTPYYHHGSGALWRAAMAHKSATFASDVGFPRQTDYSLAARLQSKDFRNHELLNLLSLGHWISGNLVLEIPDFIVDADYFLKLNPVLAAWPAKSYFVLQVGAGLPTKEWPLDRSLALGQRISAYFDMPCAIIGDAAWAERVSYEAENHGLKRYFNLCGKTSVSQLIALLNGAQILIGPCSGPKHLAMALRVPTFTLYGPSEPERWGAFFDRDSHGSIRSPLRLSPREMREYPVNATMLALEVETVSEAAIQFMRSLVGKKMLD